MPKLRLAILVPTNFYYRKLALLIALACYTTGTEDFTSSLLTSDSSTLTLSNSTLGYASTVSSFKNSTLDVLTDSTFSAVDSDIFTSAAAYKNAEEMLSVSTLSDLLDSDSFKAALIVSNGNRTITETTLAENTAKASTETLMPTPIADELTESSSVGGYQSDHATAIQPNITVDMHGRTEQLFASTTDAVLTNQASDTVAASTTTAGVLETLSTNIGPAKRDTTLLESATIETLTELARIHATGTIASNSTSPAAAANVSATVTADWLNTSKPVYDELTAATTTPSATGAVAPVSGPTLEVDANSEPWTIFDEKTSESTAVWENLPLPTTESSPTVTSADLTLAEGNASSVTRSVSEVSESRLLEPALGATSGLELSTEAATTANSLATIFTPSISSTQSYMLTTADAVTDDNFSETLSTFSTTDFTSNARYNASVGITYTGNIASTETTTRAVFTETVNTILSSTPHSTVEYSFSSPVPTISGNDTGVPGTSTDTATTTIEFELTSETVRELNTAFETLLQTSSSTGEVSLFTTAAQASQTLPEESATSSNSESSQNRQETTGATSSYYTSTADFFSPVEPRNHSVSQSDLSSTTVPLLSSPGATLSGNETFLLSTAVIDYDYSTAGINNSTTAPTQFGTTLPSFDTQTVRSRPSFAYSTVGYNGIDRDGNEAEKFVGIPSHQIILPSLTLVALVVCVTLLLVRRQSGHWPFKSKRRIAPKISLRLKFAQENNIPLGLMRQSHISRPIALAIFLNKWAHLRKDSGMLLQAEYEALNDVSPTLNQLNSKHARLDENMRRNRYVDILPFDANRVLLSHNAPKGSSHRDSFAPSSDYINASYIQGFRYANEYMAAMGPIDEREAELAEVLGRSRKTPTCGDFIRMVFEQNVKIIVMLTQCVEGGRGIEGTTEMSKRCYKSDYPEESLKEVKCAQYWPKHVNETARFGDYHVTLVSEESVSDVCAVRVLNISERKEQASSESRLVTQFHYQDMLDHSATDAIKWIRFVRRTRATVILDRSPILVHCSAGVGRTGTFIAVDAILQLLDSGAQSVDVFACVYQMRQERVRMVQTETQYALIYECIAEVLKKRYETAEDGLPDEESYIT